MRTSAAPGTPWKSRAAGAVRHSLFTVARGVYAGRSAARRGWHRARSDGPRFIVLDPDLIAPGGHHFEYARLLHAELGADNVRFYGNVAGNLAIATTFDARPIFRDSLYPRSDATFAQNCHAKSDSLVRALAAIDSDDLRPDTIAIVHTATIFSLGGLAAWYAGLPAARRPRLFVQFQHPLEFSFDQHGDPSGAALDFARDAAHTLTASGVVRFAANTTGCAELTARQLDVPCALVPVPIGWPQHPAPTEPELGSVFGFFGGLRPEKGANLLPPAISAFTEGHPDTRFIIQATPGPSDVAVVRALQPLRGVELIRTALSGASYHAALLRARWVLLPYEPEPYRLRTSGIFIEALGLGIPVIVTDGTWMADELRARGAAGAVMPEYSVEALVACLNTARIAMEAAGQRAHVPNLDVMRHYSAAAFCAEIRRLTSR